MVYINRKNIKITRLSNKLDYIKIRPFLINEVLRDITYRVCLLKHIRIYQVFYIALLKLAKGKHQHAITPKPAKDQEEVKYNVKRILASRRVSNQLQYLIKWEGFRNSDNSQEPKRNLTNCFAKLIEFYLQNPDQPG